MEATNRACKIYYEVDEKLVETQLQNEDAETVTEFGLAFRALGGGNGFSIQGISTRRALIEELQHKFQRDLFNSFTINEIVEDFLAGRLV